MLEETITKLLYKHGNLHNNVKQLRIELDQVQRDLDLDPFNSTLHEKEAIYVHAFNDAVLMEELFMKIRIDVVMDSNGTLFANDHLADAFVNHYENFLGQSGSTGVLNTEGLFLNTLDDVVSLNMSPGPDGFTAAFFKETWDIVTSDVVKAVQEFFVNGNLLKYLRFTSIISLIPRSWDILDVVQLDIQKAYDTVDWGFLKVILGAFGFHPCIITWIMECVMVFLLVAHCYYWSLVVTPGCMSVTAGSSRFVLALQTERNARLFAKQKRTVVQVVDVIKSSVRLKLLSCSFKKSNDSMQLMHLWKFPEANIIQFGLLFIMCVSGMYLYGLGLCTIRWFFPIGVIVDV
ncbi:hypothetical protein Tco_0255147 [Tanacetum coccineum]